MKINYIMKLKLLLIVVIILWGKVDPKKVIHVIYGLLWDIMRWYSKLIETACFISTCIALPSLKQDGHYFMASHSHISEVSYVDTTLLQPSLSEPTIETIFERLSSTFLNLLCFDTKTFLKLEWYPSFQRSTYYFWIGRKAYVAYLDESRSSLVKLPFWTLELSVSIHSSRSIQTA